MQNSCRKLILLTSPLLLWAACACYPVIDDWSYLTVPNFDGFLKPYYMLPRGNQWRPFDGLFGYMLSFRPTWVAALPLVALIGYILARRSIMADEKLVRSADRIR